MTGIRTDYDPKPIPDRRFDWSAVTDDYGGEESEPVGYGPTEEAAIADLEEQLDERDGEAAEKSALAAQYVEAIGYDPFADDPTITVEEVRKTLDEYRRAAAPPDYEYEDRIDPPEAFDE